MYYKALILLKCCCRYSNTLLVSLNNRISIREAPTGRGEVSSVRAQAITFPGTAFPRVAAETTEVELEKVPEASGGWSQSTEDQSQERVLGEWWYSSFPPGCCST
jgi:hypothetical protein